MQLIFVVLSGPCQILERDKQEKAIGGLYWENSKVASCIFLNRSLDLSSSNDDITSQASDTETDNCIKSRSIPGKASSGSVDLPARASRRGSQNELEVQRHHHQVQFALVGLAGLVGLVKGTTIRFDLVWFECSMAPLGLAGIPP